MHYSSIMLDIWLDLQVPPNGLVIYTGTIVTDDGKEKKLNIDFEPFKPINTSLYLCDNKFHTEALNELLESDQRYCPEQRLYFSSSTGFAFSIAKCHHFVSICSRMR